MKREWIRTGAVVVGWFLAMTLYGCEDSSPAGPEELGEAGLATAGPPVRVPFQLITIANAPPPIAHVRDAAGDPPVGDGTLLFRFFTGGSVPLTAADGVTQLRWGEWNGIDGRASVKCVRAGTHFVLHVDGAVPGGLYTAWLVLGDPAADGPFPGFPPAFVGPLGNPAGTDNAFRASAAGRGQLSVIRRDDALSCTLDWEGFVHVILAYHMDGQNHGPGPGPADTQAFHAVAMVKD